jgi:hypothetical protein
MAILCVSGRVKFDGEGQVGESGADGESLESSDGDSVICWVEVEEGSSARFFIERARARA